MVNRWLTLLVAVVPLCCPGLSVAGGPAESAVPKWVVQLPPGTVSELSVLVDQPLLFDSSETAGHPSSIGWWLTDPGGGTTVEPTSTAASYQLQVTDKGDWTVDLVLGYLHEQAPGVPYSTWARAILHAKSVVARLAQPAAQYYTVEEIVLDGGLSTWSPGTPVDVSWLIQGPSTYGCGGALVCRIPADTLSPGSYTITMTIADTAAGDTDSVSVNLTVVETPSLEIDFTWSPEQPLPGDLMVFTMTTEPPGVELVSALWDYGDDTAVNETCPLMCRSSSHRYTFDGWYTVKLSVTTVTDETATAVKQIMLGNPTQLPRATFDVSPAEPIVMDTMTFTFTGICGDSCTYEWDFGDGTSGSGPGPTHAYDHHGTFPVTLTVTDTVGWATVSTTVLVASCSIPSPTLQQGSCYGGDVLLTAPADAAQVIWSTGATTMTTMVGSDGTYWISTRPADGCWGTRELWVLLTNCGSLAGDADLDGDTDAQDLTALLSELADSDGNAVISAGGGDRRAPGGDTNLDHLLDGQDIAIILKAIFR